MVLFKEDLLDVIREKGQKIYCERSFSTRETEIEKEN
mgnify:CR=1 FL=1